METNIKLDEKVVVRSIAPWSTGARRILTVGDISIQPKGTVTISREELISQGQSGNKLLTGIDGKGSHATWYIEDDFVRKELEFDSDKKKQTFLKKEDIQKMFELKTMNAFEKNLTENVKTRAEKVFLMESIKELQINDYSKIVKCVEYTGNKL